MCRIAWLTFHDNVRSVLQSRNFLGRAVSVEVDCAFLSDNYCSVTMGKSLQNGAEHGLHHSEYKFRVWIRKVQWGFALGKFTCEETLASLRPGAMESEIFKDPLSLLPP